MSAASSDLTAILARASEKSREALLQAEDEAQAWLEGVRSGAWSADKECVICGRGGKMEDNHIAGWRHGDLTVPMCPPDHREFTEGQDLWDPRWQDRQGTPELNESLLLRGLVDLLRLKARHVPDALVGAYLALASSLREQYVRVGRRTI